MKCLRTNYFTLLELLVIVAIISMLMTILLPSLTHARSQAKSAICLSHLKNMGVITHSFVKDNTFHFPEPRWIDDFKKYEGIEQVSFCPEANGSPDSGSHKTPWTHLGESGSYGMNMWLYNFRRYDNVAKDWLRSRSEDRYYYQMTRVDEPSTTPLMFDSAWVDARPQTNADESKHFAMDGAIMHPHLGRVFINRHYDKKVNYVHVDGSARSYHLKKIYQVNWYIGFIKRDLACPK